MSQDQLDIQVLLVLAILVLLATMVQQVQQECLGMATPVLKDQQDLQMDQLVLLVQLGIQVQLVHKDNKARKVFQAVLVSLDQLDPVEHPAQ